MGRHVVLRDGALSVCKHSEAPEAEIRLEPGTKVDQGDEGSFELRLSPPGMRAAVFELASEKEKRDWLRALSGAIVRSSDPPSATGSIGIVRADARPPAVPAQATNPTDARAAIAACHRRAREAGASDLSHRTEPLGASARRTFHAHCLAAAARVSAEPVVPTGTELRPARLPTPQESGHRYLRFDRSFAHGLGHELLVYNLGVSGAPLPVLARASPC